MCHKTRLRGGKNLAVYLIKTGDYKSMDAQFIAGILLYCSYKLCKFKMADIMAAKSCFYHNMRISAWI